jgi:predicted nucleic-acid-binding protein
MNALDTNTLVRLVIGDDPQQARRVLAAMRKAEHDNTKFCVTNLVVMELIWVLESIYRLSREAILNGFDALRDMKAIAFESPDLVQSFVTQGRESRMDLSDLLIGLQARAIGCETVLTFDRKAARSPLFSTLP